MIRCQTLCLGKPCNEIASSGPVTPSDAVVLSIMMRTFRDAAVLLGLVAASGVDAN